MECSDVRGHLESGFWEAIFYRFEEHGHGRVRGGSSLDFFPGYDGCSVEGGYQGFLQ